ncbi:MAG: FtsW/RodA/SpoVE family cell cycle protein [Prevotellaceae bacterium]|nr:FtsW/RodA/SpoVE family cell cycle protein [Prevotellaceae bacterium]
MTFADMRMAARAAFSDLRHTAKGDRVLWSVVIILSAVSLLAVYSATSSLADLRGGSAFDYLIRQSKFIGLSLLLVYVGQLIPYYIYRNFAKPALYMSLILLGCTFFFGSEFNEASRHIDLGLFSFHPAEAAKFAIILYVAKVLEENSRRHTLPRFWRYARHIVAPVAVLFLLLIQMGSTSAALLMAFTVFIILTVARVRASYLWKTLALGVAGLGAVVLLSYTTPLFPRVKKMVANRVIVHFSSDAVKKDKKDLLFQYNNAKIAVASGGIIGKGPGNSTQRHILPNAYDDFIFAIIVEEYGVAGCVGVLFLYLWLFYRVAVIARSCKNLFYATVILGIMLQIVFQALLHMNVAVGLFPVTGQTLPLVSHGGSSLITTGFALGIILSVSRTANEQEKKRRVATDSTINKDTLTADE